MPRAGARDAGHFAAGRAHGTARLRVRRARCAARQAGLHVHAHRRSSHQLRTGGATRRVPALLLFHSLL